MSSLAAVFWDRVYSVSGFRRRDFETLREPAVPGGTVLQSSDRDVIETVELADTTWAEAASINKLRADLQAYVGVLRSLKAENLSRSQSRIHVKNYVEDARYKTLRQREAAQRFTPVRVVSMFKYLSLEDAGIATITDEETFAAVEELHLSRNAIQNIGFIPPNVRILSVAASAVASIQLTNDHDTLLYACLAANELTSLEFASSMPALTILDASYNAVFDIEEVIAVLDGHPCIAELDLRGNPVCLAEGYRRRLCSAIPRLQVLDGEEVSESDRMVPSREDRPPVNVASLALSLLAVKDLHLCLAGADSKTDDNAAATGGKSGKGGGKDASKKGGKADKGGKGGATQEDAPASPVFSSKRTVLLDGAWCGIGLECEDLEAAVQAVHDSEAAAEHAATGKGKGGAKGGDKKTAAAAFASAAGEGTTGEAEPEPKPIIRTSRDIGGEPEHVARGLVSPCTMTLTEHCITTPSFPPGSSAAQDTPTGSTPVSTVQAGTSPGPLEERLTIGTATFDFSSLANTVIVNPSVGTDPVVLKAKASAPIVVNAVAVAERAYRVDTARVAIGDAQALVDTLERKLADALRPPTPSGAESDGAALTQSATAPKPGAKKAAAPGKTKPPAGGAAAAAPAMSEEAMRLQDEVAAAKTALEEKQAMLTNFERLLATHKACAGVELTVQCVITCRGPDVEPPEPQADPLASTVSGQAPAKDAKKGKK